MEAGVTLADPPQVLPRINPAGVTVVPVEAHRIASHRRHLFRPLAAAYCLAFSLDGAVLASGHYDTTVLVWDLRRIRDQLLEEHRIVLLRGDINDQTAKEAIACLLFLQHQDAKAPIHLYIDSLGGALPAGQGRPGAGRTL